MCLYSKHQLLFTRNIDYVVIYSFVSFMMFNKLRASNSMMLKGCIFNMLQVINHGMTPEFLDKVRQTTKKFFELPVDEKLIYSRESNDIEGYGNDMVLSEKTEA